MARLSSLLNGCAGGAAASRLYGPHATRFPSYDYMPVSSLTSMVHIISASVMTSTCVSLRWLLVDKKLPMAEGAPSTVVRGKVRQRGRACMCRPPGLAHLPRFHSKPLVQMRGPLSFLAPTEDAKGMTPHVCPKRDRSTVMLCEPCKMKEEGGA